MLDRRGRLLVDDVGELPQRHRPAGSRADRDLRNELGILTPLAGELQNQRIARPALEDHPRRNPPHRRHRPHHFGGVDAMAGKLFGADIDSRGGNVGLPVGPHVDRPADAAEQPLDPLPQIAERVEVVAVDEHGDIRLHPGDELVNTHLDRLAEAEVRPRHRRREGLRHPPHELVARHLGRPHPARLEHHPDVRLLHPHDVVGDLRPPRFAEHRPDLGELLQHVLDPGRDRHRILEGRAR